MAKPTLTLIMPDKNGFLSPTGQRVPYYGNDVDPVAFVFSHAQQHLKRAVVKLSIAIAAGDKQQLAQIDPDSQQTIAELGLTGAEVPVSFN